MRFNKPVRAAELAAIGRAMGVAREEYDDERAAEEAIAGVTELATAIGLPAGLAELGVAEEELPGLSRQALGVSRLIVNNPREPTEQDLIEILRAAWRGELAPAGAHGRSAIGSAGSPP
jgi:alcohol dehydrogenase